MSRSRKNKNLDEFEQLRKENKELTEINKSLSRQIKKLNRDVNKNEDNSDDLIEEEYSKKIRCPSCSKGNIKITDLGVRKLQTCSINCGYRKTIK